MMTIHPAAHPVVLLNEKGKPSAFFASQTAAARHLSVSLATVSRAARRIIRGCKGYRLRLATPSEVVRFVMRRDQP